MHFMRSMLRSALVGGAVMVALSAVGAASASATQFKCAEYPCTIKAVSASWSAEFPGGADSAYKCEKGNLSGELNEASETLSMSLSEYEGCKVIGLLDPATVKMNGCKYLFHTNGTVDIGGEGCGPITVETGTCVTQISSQSGLKSVSYKNVAGEVDISSRVSKLIYRVTKAGLGCGSAKEGRAGTYEEFAAAEAFHGGTQVKMEVN